MDDSRCLLAAGVVSYLLARHFTAAKIWRNRHFLFPAEESVLFWQWAWVPALDFGDDADQLLYDDPVYGSGGCDPGGFVGVSSIVCGLVSYGILRIRVAD